MCMNYFTHIIMNTLAILLMWHVYLDEEGDEPCRIQPYP